jgi:hypothetical protein
MTTIYVTRDTPLPTRRPREFYATEDLALIRGALARYALAKGGAPGYILDPGAGDGRWGREAGRLYPGAAVHGVELRRVVRPAGFAKWWACRDFVKWRAPSAPELVEGYHLAVGNPPYNRAEAFVRHTWAMLAPGGRIIFLLPLQFQASLGRYNGLWVELPLTLVAVVCPRPSFGKNSKGKRGTNGTDYGLYIWDKAPDGRPVGTPRRWPSELFVYEPDR